MLLDVVIGVWIWHSHLCVWVFKWTFSLRHS